jgi:hypothetical protein
MAFIEAETIVERPHPRQRVVAVPPSGRTEDALHFSERERRLSRRGSLGELE